MQNLSTAYKSVQSFWQNLPDGYRYGFQGQEKDDEIKGEGNRYDFGARMYDARVGRFLSIDPHCNGYPDISPYVFAINNPPGEPINLNFDIPIIQLPKWNSEAKGNGTGTGGFIKTTSSDAAEKTGSNIILSSDGNIFPVAGATAGAALPKTH